MLDVAVIQESLRDRGIDGWLFCDFRGSDKLAASILRLGSEMTRTRRWFYYLPAKGTPVRIVHAIEPGALDDVPGEKIRYSSWRRLREALSQTLAGSPRVAMQYSPMNDIPYIGRVDAGTVELVRSLGVQVVSSADLVQEFEARISESAWQTHVEAADELGRLVNHCFAEIGRRLRSAETPTEHAIQQVMLAGFKRAGLVTDHDPIVAVGAHSADPHYAPSRTSSESIGREQLVLIDTWAKQDRPGAIYADITWVGFTGSAIPDEMTKVFEIVRDARDAATQFVREAQSLGEPARGCDVDDVARGVIERAGFGEYFIHRTGHSIHEVGHGNGANLDNLETRDERRLIPRTCFSIEPGIYLPGRFGVRSEIDVFLPDARSLIVSGPTPQREIVRIPCQ